MWYIFVVYEYSFAWASISQMALQVNLVEVMETKFMDRKLRWNIYRLYYWTLGVCCWAGLRFGTGSVRAGIIKVVYALIYAYSVDPCSVMPSDRRAAGLLIPKQFYITIHCSIVHIQLERNCYINRDIHYTHCTQTQHTCVYLFVFICASSNRLNCLCRYFFLYKPYGFYTLTK